MSIAMHLTISAAERDRRQQAVAAAAHSSAMEGLAAGQAFRADAEAYAAGDLDHAELLRRTRARWGLA